MPPKWISYVHHPSFRPGFRKTTEKSQCFRAQVLEVPRQVLLQEPLVPQHEGLHQKQLTAQAGICTAYEGLGGAGGPDAIGPRANVGLRAEVHGVSDSFWC